MSGSRRRRKPRAEAYYEGLASGRIEYVGDALALAYRWAADALVDRAASGEEPWRIVAVPVLFLYRQHLELAIKNCAPYVRRYIERGQNLVGSERSDFVWTNPGTHGHALLASWKSLRTMFEASDLDHVEELTQQAEHVIEWMDALDRTSLTLRYPEEFLEAGIDVDEIDPLQLKEGIAVASSAVGGLRDWLDDLIHAGPQISDSN